MTSLLFPKPLRLACSLLAVASLTPSVLADTQSRAIELMREGQFERSLQITQRELEKDPGHPAVRFLKAYLEQGMGRQAAAIATYKGLIQDHPALPEPYHNLAILYAAQGQTELARSTLEQSAQASRSLANVHEQLVAVYAHMSMRNYRLALQLPDEGAAPTAALPLIRQLIRGPAADSSGKKATASDASGKPSATAKK